MCDGENSSLVRKLFNAVIRNDVKEVLDLVRNQGIDVDSRDARRLYLHQTALHKAAKKGYLDMVRVLVEDLGADINIDDISGFSPIQRAIQYGKANVAKYLVEKQCYDADEYYDWKNTSTLEIDDQNFDVNIFRDELESESESEKGKENYNANNNANKPNKV